MPIVIKKIRVHTVVEKRIITEADVSEELLRKIESRVKEELSAGEGSSQPATRRWQRKKNER